MSVVQHRLQVLQDPSVTLSCWHLENSLLCHSSRKIKKRSAAQWLSIMNRCLWDSEPPLVGERGGYLKSLEITSFHLVLVCNYLQTIYHPCGWEREREFIWAGNEGMSGIWRSGKKKKTFHSVHCLLWVFLVPRNMLEQQTTNYCACIQVIILTSRL